MKIKNGRGGGAAGGEGEESVGAREERAGGAGGARVGAGQAKTGERAEGEEGPSQTRGTLPPPEACDTGMRKTELIQ